MPRFFPVRQLPVDVLEKSLSFRAAPLLWAQPCLEQASACNLAACCSLSPLPARLPLHSCWGADGLRAGSLSLRTIFLQTWEISPLGLAVSWMWGLMCLESKYFFFFFSPSLLVFHWLKSLIWCTAWPDERWCCQKGCNSWGWKGSGADRLTGLRATWKHTLNCEQRAKLCLCCHPHAYLLKGHLCIQIATWMCKCYLCCKRLFWGSKCVLDLGTSSSVPTKWLSLHMSLHGIIMILFLQRVAGFRTSSVNFLSYRCKHKTCKYWGLHYRYFH